MTSYTLQVQPRRQYSIQYSNERGPQGPAGSNASATTDASLLVSGTLSDARLSSNVAFKNAANVFTAKQSFSGTSHSGLCLHSLTTTEYNALTPGNGDLFRDSTTDRIDARLARGTVELLDTAGGQQIGGNLAITGNLTFNSGSVINSGSGGVGTLTINNDGNSRWQFNASEFIVAGNIRPSTNNARNIGDTSFRWANVFGVTGNFSQAVTAANDANAVSYYAQGAIRKSSNGLWYFDVPFADGQFIFRNGTGFTERFRIDTSGNTTASGTVTASGTGTHTFGTTNTVTIANGLARVNGSNGGFVVNDRTTAADWILYSTANRLRILGSATSAADFVTISSTGVGIGLNVTPAARLHLTDATQARLDLQRTTTGGTPASGAYWRLFVDNVGGGGGDCTFGFFDVANSALRFGVENDGRFRVFSNLTVDQTIRLGSFTVGTLPSAAANTRARAFVTDSNLAFTSANLGATVTAGGSTLVPVFSNGTNWVIG